MRKLFSFKRAFLKRFFILNVCFFLSMFSALTAQKQNSQEDCLTLQQIIELLEKEIEQSVIIENVEKYGVDFDVDYSIAAKLARAGAEDKLIKAIEGSPCSVLTITFPKNEAECGVTARIEGKSKKFPGKYLWVFAHLKLLKYKWWPQVGAIDVDEDGKWKGMAYLGGPHDIGSDFEIVAMWVEPNIHQMLTEYLNKGDQTGNYPPIQLPNGSPSAKVVVRKIKH